MKLKRIGCLLLAVSLSLPIATPISSFAAGRFTDTAGHWAENYINTVANEKIITGYPDGRFLPNKAVTRAEFATMINKALGNSDSATLSFKDVSHGAWYYNDVSKALAAAYTAGYDDNTFRPNNPITRQEAAVMISRIIPVYGSGGNLKSYSDYRTISDWAYSALEKVNGKGYIGAYTDGKIHPSDPLTRAQTAKIICDIISKETIVSSNPTISKAGTKLSGKIYVNNVTIDEDLGENSATIDNCVILGTLAVKGGGTDTITINNSRVVDVTVNKDSDPVRILAKGETSIGNLSASEASILQTSSLSGGLFGPGFSNVTVNGSADVTLKGSFPKVTIGASKAKLILSSGSIKDLTVNGKYSNITAESGTTIDKATVNAESYFHGNGTISKMNVNADDITYETKPKSWSIASNADTPTRKEGSLSITFSPKNGAANVYLDSKVTITFGSAVKMYDGDTISSSNIDDILELRKDSATGSKVDFSAAISSDRKVITITPSSNLAESTRYYLIMDNDSVKDSNGAVNAKQTVSFNTGTNTQNVTATYIPANGATTVSVNPTITVSFSDSVVRYSNSATISSNDSYLRECLVFKTNSFNGSDVAYSAVINSTKKTITITPNFSLNLNQKYYVAVIANKLKTRRGTTVPASSVTWTTGITTPVLNSFTVSPADTSITATMTPNVAGKLYAVVLPSGSAAPSAVQIAAGQNNSGSTAIASARNESAAASASVSLPSLGGLASGTAYDVWATLYSTASGSYSTPVKQTATTTLPKITLDSMTVKPLIKDSTGNDLISFRSGTNNYSIGLNSSIKNVELRISGDASATITLTGNGLGIVTGTGHLTTNVDIPANPSISITISASGRTSSSYTINLNSVNDASLKLLKIDGSSQSSSDSSFAYALSTTGAISIPIEVSTNDNYAVITAPIGTDVTVNPSKDYMGSASYMISLVEGALPIAIAFTVDSGGTVTTYTVTFTRPQ